jgi:hypothetical protein
VRAERAEKPKSLNQVGLPLAVAPDDEVRPRFKGNLDRRIVAKIGEER